MPNSPKPTRPDFAPRRLVRPGLLLWLAGALLVASTGFARANGLNPESLWYDDLAWAIFAKLREVRTLFHAPVSSTPGFLGLLALSSWVFPDPEWGMQVVPFVAGLAGIPLMMALTWRISKSVGAGLLAGAVTALNPLLAQYSIYAKNYTLDFLCTGLLLYGAIVLLERREISRTTAVGFLFAAAATFVFSATSIFVAVPAISALAWRDWALRRTRVPLVAGSGLLVGLGLLAFAVWFRGGHGGERPYDIEADLLGRVFSPLGYWKFITLKLRSVAETSLPSWIATTTWEARTVPWTATFIPLGALWVIVRRETRGAGLLLLASLALFTITTYTELYPLTNLRRNICSFPIFIVLAIMGVHAVSALVPWRETVRTAVGLAVVLFAVMTPVPVEYWGVNDVRLIRRLTETVQPTEGVILSPAGTYLAAYYGPWRVAFNTHHDSDRSGVSILRERTLQLPRNPGRARRAVEQFLSSSRLTGVAYVAFRDDQKAVNTVLRLLDAHGYAATADENTTRGSLYIARQRQAGAE